MALGLDIEYIYIYIIVVTDCLCGVCVGRIAAAGNAHTGKPRRLE